MQHAGAAVVRTKQRRSFSAFRVAISRCNAASWKRARPQVHKAAWAVFVLGQLQYAKFPYQNVAPRQHWRPAVGPIYTQAKQAMQLGGHLVCPRRQHHPGNPAPSHTTLTQSKPTHLQDPRFWPAVE